MEKRELDKLVIEAVNNVLESNAFNDLLDWRAKSVKEENSRHDREIELIEQDFHRKIAELARKFNTTPGEE